MKKNMMPLLKEAAVTLGLAENNDFTSNNLVEVLKELAVAVDCAESVSDIDTNSISGVLNYITENGESVVYPEPTGTKTITENGTHDVKDYASAEVAVPASAVVSGSISIAENGTYDVTEKASAVVNVASLFLQKTIKLRNDTSTNIMCTAIMKSGISTFNIQSGTTIELPLIKNERFSGTYKTFFRLDSVVSVSLNGAVSVSNKVVFYNGEYATLVEYFGNENYYSTNNVIVIS